MCPFTGAGAVAGSQGLSHSSKGNQFKQLSSCGEEGKDWGSWFSIYYKNCLIDLCYKDVSVLLTSTRNRLFKLALKVWKLSFSVLGIFKKGDLREKILECSSCIRCNCLAHMGYGSLC